jgi:hypothetical protein
MSVISQGFLRVRAIWPVPGLFSPACKELAAQPFDFEGSVKGPLATIVMGVPFGMNS